LNTNYTFSATSTQLRNSWENNASVKEALKSQKYLQAAHSAYMHITEQFKSYFIPLKYWTFLHHADSSTNFSLKKQLHSVSQSELHTCYVFQYNCVIRHVDKFMTLQCTTAIHKNAYLKAKTN